MGIDGTNTEILLCSGLQVLIERISLLIKCIAEPKNVALIVKILKKCNIFLAFDEIELNLFWILVLLNWVDPILYDSIFVLRNKIFESLGEV